VKRKAARWQHFQRRDVKEIQNLNWSRQNLKPSS
jgi:hypothetical protein